MSIPEVKLHRYLYPLSWVYQGVTTLRNKLFDCNILRSRSFSVPVICIGNLSVGGTGKTPHTEYIVNLLKDEYNVAVLSRGYKRKTKGYLLSDENSNAATIGDEPFQIKSKFPEIRVAVDENRCHGIEEVMKLKNPETDVILLDDAYQHRYVKAGLYILLTDYNRLFSEDAVLPAGRLRESENGKERAQIVIVTKCPAGLPKDEREIIARKLNLFPHQELYFSMFDYSKLHPLFPEMVADGEGFCIDTEALKDKDILVVTGIASPAPLIKMLKKYAKSVEMLTFGDHHDFNKKEIELIQTRFESLDKNKRLIITTEKDGTRLKIHPDLSEEIKPFIYVQPIEVKILNEQQNNLNQHIRDYVRENQ